MNIFNYCLISLKLLKNVIYFVYILKILFVEVLQIWNNIFGHNLIYE